MRALVGVIIPFFWAPFLTQFPASSNQITLSTLHVSEPSGEEAEPTDSLLIRLTEVEPHGVPGPSRSKGRVSL